MLAKGLFIGYITHDLKKEYLRDADGEYSKLNFQIAVNHNNDEQNKKVSFFNITAFRFQADIIFNNLCKGSKVFVEAFITNMKIQTDTDPNGKWYFNIIVKNCIFLETKEQTEEKRKKLGFNNFNKQNINQTKSNVKVNLNGPFDGPF